VLEYDVATATVGRRALSIFPATVPAFSYSAEQLEEALLDVTDGDDLIPAVVLEASPKLIKAYCRAVRSPRSAAMPCYSFNRL